MVRIKCRLRTLIPIEEESPRTCSVVGVQVRGLARGREESAGDAACALTVLDRLASRCVQGTPTCAGGKKRALEAHVVVGLHGAEALEALAHEPLLAFPPECRARARGIPPNRLVEDISQPLGVVRGGAPPSDALTGRFASRQGLEALSDSVFIKPLIQRTFVSICFQMKNESNMIGRKNELG